eukprot:TRINITY_DN9342_c0_g1_i6.p1 TRINITY_DN9342_c0_g1~~TRINITY_DN9342_c0_g1_i6.p1  ORF type:complete len:626 (+),score=125.99 TRINITY_DN9342_c0_g1_i6:233-2110(+)
MNNLGRRRWSWQDIAETLTVEVDAPSGGNGEEAFGSPRCASENGVRLNALARNSRTRVSLDTFSPLCSLDAVSPTVSLEQLSPSAATAARDDRGVPVINVQSPQSKESPAVDDAQEVPNRSPGRRVLEDAELMDVAPPPGGLSKEKTDGSAASKLALPTTKAKAASRRASAMATVEVGMNLPTMQEKHNRRSLLLDDFQEHVRSGSRRPSKRPPSKQIEGHVVSLVFGSEGESLPDDTKPVAKQSSKGKPGEQSGAKAEIRALQSRLQAFSEMNDHLREEVLQQHGQIERLRTAASGGSEGGKHAALKQQVAMMRSKVGSLRREVQAITVDNRRLNDILTGASDQARCLERATAAAKSADVDAGPSGKSLPRQVEEDDADDAGANDDSVARSLYDKIARFTGPRQLQRETDNVAIEAAIDLAGTVTLHDTLCSLLSGTERILMSRAATSNHQPPMLYVVSDWLRDNAAVEVAKHVGEHFNIHAKKMVNKSIHTDRRTYGAVMTVGGKQDIWDNLLNGPTTYFLQGRTMVHGYSLLMHKNQKPPVFMDLSATVMRNSTGAVLPLQAGPGQPVFAVLQVSTLPAIEREVESDDEGGSEAASDAEGGTAARLSEEQFNGLHVLTVGGS